MRLELRSASSFIGAIAFGTWEILQFFGLTSAPINSGDHRFPVPQRVQVAENDEQNTCRDELSTDKEVSLNEETSINEHYRTLEKKVEMLKSARSFIVTRKNYTAILTKREVVRGELLDEQSMSMKVRLNPFSVYLNWNVGDVGREAIYIEGKNDGKMVAHDGGWKARIPAFCMTPDCFLAMRDNRYPITSAGLLFLIDTMLAVHENDLKTINFRTCHVTSDQVFDGHTCLAFTTAYKSKELSPTYRKSITFLDQDSCVPLSTEHFEWPTQTADSTESGLDQATLIEQYSFHGLAFDQEISEKDFDRSNREYNFR